MRGKVLHVAVKAAFFLKRTPRSDNYQSKNQKANACYYRKFRISPQIIAGYKSLANLITIMK